MNEPKRKRDSPGSQASNQHEIFDPPLTLLDTPDSPLSDYPDNLSDCSEARADKRLKYTHVPPYLEIEHVHIPVYGQQSRPLPPSPPWGSGLRKSHIVKLKVSLVKQTSHTPLHQDIDEWFPQSPTWVPQSPEPVPQSPEWVPQSPGTYLAVQGPPTPAEAPLPVVPEPSPTFTYSTKGLELMSKTLNPPFDPSIPKPEPSGQPKVWADGRQELCETLHYFRSWQGGGYTSGGLAWGFMFDKTAHPRDYIDSDVVISRAGGSMVKNKDSGEMALGGDQTEGTQASSLRNSMKQFNPVVIIVGADNPNMPSTPPHTYCVLDHFKPTHIWSEKSKGKVMVRYRFEKLNPRKPSWWKPNDLDPYPNPHLPEPETHTCSKCGIESPRVYLQGWMCLQPACGSFWKLEGPLEGGDEPDEDTLLYDPRFLKQKTTWPNEKHEYSLTSNNVELSGHDVSGEDCSRAYWSGMVCPDCGRCIMRLSWVAWECSCGFKKAPPHTFIPATALRDPYFPLTTEYGLSRDTFLPHIGIHISFDHNYRIHVYRIPGIEGFVAHLIANKAVVEEYGGPDYMFEELQKQDIGLRRRPLPNGMLKGESYTRHFAVNYGMPYKFIAATASESFENASSAITNARTRLIWTSKMLGGELREEEFNEVLALGYFEQQRINYHDDGEHGIGPTIATLSLGAPGTMKIRMKARHYNGMSKDGIYNDESPRPGCDKFKERLDAKDELQTLQQNSKGEYRARLKTIGKEMGLKGGGQAKDAITMNLGHGDIVVMHGQEIQKYYEHSVEHAGKLRFALTCRYIDPASLREEDKPSYVVGRDSGVYRESGLGGK